MFSKKKRIIWIFLVSKNPLSSLRAPFCIQIISFFFQFLSVPLFELILIRRQVQVAVIQSFAFQNNPKYLLPIQWPQTITNTSANKELYSYIHYAELVCKFLTPKSFHSISNLPRESIPTMSPILLLFTYFLCVQSAPTTEPPVNNEVIVKKNESYDVSQFDEVYDQRQNGSENYRVNVNKVVLVWTPPGSLLTAAMLLDPSLYEPEFSEDFFKPESEEKPENFVVIKPETTKAPEAQASAPEATTVGSTKR